MKVFDRWRTHSMHYPYVMRLLSLAIPIGLTRLLYMISGFIGLFMLAKLGNEPLAAGFLCLSAFSVILLFCSAIFQALSLLIRKNLNSTLSATLIANLLQSALLLSLGIAALAACLLWYADNILYLTGQPSTLVSLSRAYFRMSAWTMFPAVLLAVLNQFIVGTRSAKMPFTLEAGLFLPRLGLYYTLIYGYWGAPALGLMGIALSECILRSLALLGLGCYLSSSKFYKPYHQPLKTCLFSFNKKAMQSLLSIGLPIALQSSGEITAMSVAGYLMGQFGVTALAALTVTNQYMIPVMMFAYGLSQAITLIMSEIKDEADALQQQSLCLQAALLIFFIYLSPFIILFLNYAPALLTLFVPTVKQTAELQSLSHAFFIIILWFLGVEGIRNILIGSLWALSHSYQPVIKSLGIIWFMGLPLAYLCGFSFHGGPIGLRLGLLSGLIVSLLWLAFHLFKLLSNRVQDLKARTSQFN